MPISKVQVPSLTTPIDIRNGHSANVVYSNEQFSAQVNTVNNPYVGLILSLYFPAVLDIESGVKQVSLTFGNSETYTTSFLILGYSYEYVVPVLIQIKSIDNGVLTYDILHKGSVPSSSSSIDVGIDSQDDTQLNFDTGSNAQSTIVITYPDEDIEGTSYEVYAGGNNECLVPPYTSADKGKVLTVGDVPNPPSVRTLIPEQSVTTDTETTVLGQTVYKGDIVNADTSNIEDGYEYTLTVDGTDYYIIFSDGLAAEFDAGVAIQIEGSSCVMIAFTNNETHTIKLTSVEQTSSANAGWFADGIAIVNITFDSASQSFNADKTFNEIAAAYNSGLKLYARADFTEDALTRLYHYGIGVDEYHAQAVGTILNTHTNKAYLRTGHFAISSSGTNLVWEYYVELTAGETP